MMEFYIFARNYTYHRYCFSFFIFISSPWMQGWLKYTLGNQGRICCFDILDFVELYS